jgi:hypothetical protein
MKGEKGLPDNLLLAQIAYSCVCFSGAHWCRKLRAQNILYIVALLLA